MPVPTEFLLTYFSKPQLPMGHTNGVCVTGNKQLIDVKIHILIYKNKFKQFNEIYLETF